MKTVHWICAAAFAALLIAGGAGDLPLSTALFNPQSRAALFFERFGHIPGDALLPLGGACLFCAALAARRALRPAAAFALAAGGAACAALGVAVIGHILARDPGLAPASAYAVTAALALAAFAGARPVARAHPRSAALAGVLAVACVALPLVITGALKAVWGRERFFAMNDPLTDFTPWFAPRPWGKTDEFRSFPSGHTAAAAALVWLTCLPAYFKSLAPLKYRLAALVVLYVAAVALSRVVLGRHFLSDVSAGAAVTLCCYFVCRALLDRYGAALETRFRRRPSAPRA